MFKLVCQGFFSGVGIKVEGWGCRYPYSAGVGLGAGRGEEGAELGFALDHGVV